MQNHSGYPTRGCVKSLRPSYTGLFPQKHVCPTHAWVRPPTISAGGAQVLAGQHTIMCMSSTPTRVASTQIVGDTFGVHIIRSPRASRSYSTLDTNMLLCFASNTRTRVSNKRVSVSNHTGRRCPNSGRTRNTATRWSMTFSSQVNLSHAIDFCTSCGANLVSDHWTWASAGEAQVLAGQLWLRPPRARGPVSGILPFGLLLL